jgi:hypothetical protein
VPHALDAGAHLRADSQIRGLKAAKSDRQRLQGSLNVQPGGNANRNRMPVGRVGVGNPWNRDDFGPAARPAIAVVLASETGKGKKQEQAPILHARAGRRPAKTPISSGFQFTGSILWHAAQLSGLEIGLQ